MARPSGLPSTRKEMCLEDRQIEYLEALRSVSPIGKPSFTSLVKQALDEFIYRQLSNAETKEQVERHRKTNRVVSIRKVEK